MGHLIRQVRVAVFVFFLVCFVGLGAVCVASAQLATVSAEAQQPKLEASMSVDFVGVPEFSSVGLVMWVAVTFAAVVIVMFWLLNPKGLSMVRDPGHL